MEQLTKATTKQHYTKYAELATELHVTLDQYKNGGFLGLSSERLRDKFILDPNLNNIPLRRWDGLAFGLLSYGGRGRGLSIAECVCLYKHLAVYQLIGAVPNFTDEEE